MFNPGLWRARGLSGMLPEMLNLQREMNRLFSSAAQRPPQEYPALNVWEKEGAAVVTAELPGMDPEKMDITVTGDSLKISGEIQQEKAEGVTYLRQERGVGTFQRSIKLPFQVDFEAVEARYEKGVLIIMLPRIKEDLPRKIKLQ